MCSWFILIRSVGIVPAGLPQLLAATRLQWDFFLAVVTFELAAIPFVKLQTSLSISDFRSPPSSSCSISPLARLVVERALLFCLQESPLYLRRNRFLNVMRPLDKQPQPVGGKNKLFQWMWLWQSESEEIYRTDSKAFRDYESFTHENM